jgi:hypothetical protein
MRYASQAPTSWGAAAGQGGGDGDTLGQQCGVEAERSGRRDGVQR